MSEAKEREAICAIGASIFMRGLTAGSSGNISLRVEDGWLMTPTNASLGRLDPARLAKLDRDGRLVAGDPPTKESFLHRVMYDERPGTGAVVHLHSTHSVAVSCLAEIDPADVMPPITAYYVMRVGRLPLVPYFRPGDLALAEAVRGFAGSTTPCCWPITARSSPARASTPRSTRSRNSRRPQSSISCCAAPRRRYLTPAQVRELQE